MSKAGPFSKRKEELKQKEKLLLDDLNESGAKYKNILIWSLVAGAVALLFYGIYRAFFHIPEKPKKSKRKISKPSVPEDYPGMDAAIRYVGPRLGKWILSKLKN